MKVLRWVGSSRRDMRDLPQDVRRAFGLSLFAVQSGVMPPNAKALKGFGGAHVQELTEMDGAGTYRTVYTVRFEDAIYVLHVFQKKSKSGRATPRSDIDLINERLARVNEERRGRRT